MTIILVAVGILAWQIGDNHEKLFRVEVLSGESREKIDCWTDSQGNRYVFLPGYAELSKVRFVLHTDTEITLNGEVLSDGADCRNIPLNEPCRLEYTHFGEKKEQSVTFVQSGHVATLYIDTRSGSMEYIHQRKKNSESAELRLYTAEGEPSHSGSVRSIQGRGNASWNDSEKKSYSLDLQEAGDLLSMGAADRWILLANAADRSNLRNKTVFDFASAAGLAYSPESRWVDLYLNGEYAGLYLLCERNEVHPQRVNISEEESFLISVELETRLQDQNYPYVATEQKQALRIHYPKDVSAKDLEELDAFWQSVENALIAEDGIDPVTGRSWHEMIDLDSWARKYLMEEVFCSIDGCILSQFFYRDGSDPAGKVYAGPVWDFDKSMGTTLEWETIHPVTLYANGLHERAGLSTPWFYSLYQKPEFYDRVAEIYTHDVLPLLEELLAEGLDANADSIAQAVVTDQIRWGVAPDAFERELETIRAYMTERTRFLKSLWTDGVEYCFVNADYGYDCSYAVRPGERLEGLWQFENVRYADFLGWYYTDTDEPFDPAKPITEDVDIYPKWHWPEIHEEPMNLWKLVPLAVIGLLGILLAAVELRRMMKSR